MTSTRGALAHGDNEVTSAGARDFYELTLLAETVCGLLSLSGLEWDFDRLSTAHYHPMQMAIHTLQLYDAERARRTAETT
jgi:hypothetical protein